MTDQEFAQAIALGHELSGLEFKSPGSLSDRRLAAQVVKAILGLANRRDGGSVIIGVTEQDGILRPEGISAADLRAWHYDAVADQVSRYADPGVYFELEIKEHNGNRYVVIEVAEFDDIPVLCRRAYDGVLRRGACYVRTRRKPETTEIPTQADMRDLLDLATVKWIRRYGDWMRRAGLTPAAAASPPDADAARFAQESEGGL